MSYKIELTNENLEDFLQDILNLKLNTQEIIQVLNQANIHNTIYFYEESLFYNELRLTDEIFDLEQQCFELAAQKGGYEGGGEEFFEVIKIKPLNTYIKHEGSYYSYAGIDSLGNFYQVYPYQELKTYYSSTPKKDNL